MGTLLEEVSSVASLPCNREKSAISIRLLRLSYDSQTARLRKKNTIVQFEVSSLVSSNSEKLK
jgi:hypothetical protein